MGAVAAAKARDGLMGVSHTASTPKRARRAVVQMVEALDDAGNVADAVGVRILKAAPAESKRGTHNAEPPRRRRRTENSGSNEISSLALLTIILVGFNSPRPLDFQH